MRRKGVLTGYLWNRNSFVKVKVKGKPTNASNASGRCIRAKCSVCHELPVSKAKSKTKGRNKRALSRFLVDDEWAFCKRTSAGRGVKVVPSHVDRYTYDALDACPSDAELSGHDVDDDSYDACHAGANPMGHEVKDNDLDTDYANDDHDINIADDVSDVGIHAHGDVKDVRMLVFGMDGKLYTVTYPIPVYPNRLVLARKVVPDVNPGICEKSNDIIVANDDDVNYGCHATMAHAKDDVSLEEEEEDDDDANDSNANQESQAMMVQAAEDVSDDDDDDVYGDEDTNDVDRYTYDALDACPSNAELSGNDVDRYTCDALDACPSNAELSDDDVDDDASDAYDACHAGASPVGHEVKGDDFDTDYANDDHSDAGIHAHDDVSLVEEEVEEDNDRNANQESHAMMVQAAEDVSDDDDDDVYGDEDTNDFQSLISCLVNVGLPTCSNNNEEVLEVECEENSLGGNWCYVASSDAIDDWYLC